MCSFNQNIGLLPLVLIIKIEPIGLGGCPGWPWPGCRGGVVYTPLACPHAYPLRIDKDIDDN